MTRTFNNLAVLAAMASCACGFTPETRQVASLTLSSSFMAPCFADGDSHSANRLAEQDLTPIPPSHMPPSELLYSSYLSQEEKSGILAPMVLFGKQLLGDRQLNRLRGNMIAKHSAVIKSFVGTAETKIGNVVLQTLFHVADRNGNGQIELQELERALGTLGLSWLKEKQIQGIFQRADGDDKGYITMEEWMTEAPKALKTNLVKLAKTNGRELGFLG